MSRLLKSAGEGREWNGSECVAVDIGYDTGSDAAAEELEPECYTHAECGDDELCVEGSCESIEEACRIDESAPCDENSRFEGVYEIIRQGFTLYNQDQIVNFFAFNDTENDCVHPGIATFSSLSADPVCVDYGDNRHGNQLVLIETDLVNPGETLEFIKCTPTIIRLRWAEQASADSILQLYGPYGDDSCYIP